jgi:glutathione gamma-glutamylcysteinyltransferase
MSACSHCTPPPSFYRRDLPFNLHDFASHEGRSLFQKSLVSGKAVNFFSLSGNYTAQSDPAYCGLSSVSIVLNALAVDPGRKWKGVRL